MATQTELALFADKTAFAIPVVDYQVGAPSGLALKGLASLLGLPGVSYNATARVLTISADNTVINGYDLRGVTLAVKGSNVTVTNSIFDASTGYFSISQEIGATGLTVDHCTFDGLKLDIGYSNFVRGGSGSVSLTYNTFLNAPSDAVQLRSGVVDHNYFSGSGYATGAHADAIWVDGTTGNVSITNNFIDYRKAVDARVETTSAVNIGNSFGDHHTITVSNNVLLGGAYTVYALDMGQNNDNKVFVTNNFIGGGLYGDLYPNRQPAQLVYSGNGETVTGLVTSYASPGAGIKVLGSSSMPGELLVGTERNDWLYGGGDGDTLVGGGGRDFMFGKAGVDTFAYRAVSDSSGAYTDVISGFQSGIDKLDFKAIAAAIGDISYVGAKAFSGAARELHTVKIGTSTWVELDSNGDKVADMRIELAGGPNLLATDFILKSATALPVVAAPVVEAPAVTTPTAISTTTTTSTTTATSTTTSTSAIVVGKVGVAEMLMGDAATNWVRGNGDGDIIVGAGGRDFLFGAAGRDTFKFLSAADSFGTATDVIASFDVGVDKLDLKAIASAGQALKFIGQTGFTGEAGAVNFVKSGLSTWVQADLDGDRFADFRVEIKGAPTLSSIDFIL